MARRGSTTRHALWGEGGPCQSLRDGKERGRITRGGPGGEADRKAAGRIPAPKKKQTNLECKEIGATARGSRGPARRNRESFQRNRNVSMGKLFKREDVKKDERPIVWETENKKMCEDRGS